jgi:Ca2+-transporting ATPase
MTEPETKTSPTIWHALELPAVFRLLKVNPEQGLSEEEARNRQLAWGKNQLPQVKKTGFLTMFLRQFKSPLVYILLIAAALTFWIREYSDMTVILIVVVVNAAIGYFQEFRASQIFEKLKKLVRVEAVVVRSGKISTLDAEELVPGDIIILKAGRKVPADARLISVSNLEANETILTGESLPIRKQTKKLKSEAILSERTNLVFMGTVLEAGEGLAVVVATGARTEVGQISLLAQETKSEESPLKLRMEKLGGFLSKLFVALAVMIFIIGVLRNHNLVEMIKTTIAVAVAAIPEGLPAAISVILAVASQKILNRKGLVRRLLAAETLGSTSVICTDKTGTLTYGEMKVEELVPYKTEDRYNLLLAMALANEAVIEEKEGRKLLRGEATDRAKLEKFLEAGFDLGQILKEMPRFFFLPFDAERKYIASFHKTDKADEIYVSGAPEIVLRHSRLSLGEKQQIQKIYENHAKRGLRMIALAKKTARFSERIKDPEKQIQNLEYLGFAAIGDPIRQDVKNTLKITRRAGIKILMITGDHLLTAKAVGEELGFRASQENITSGQELEQLSDKELLQKISKLEIISRATAVHKMRIIAAWQKLGAVVAMTGDGVNDAPALKAADIGVAIGSGTDVAKEASDLILLDDSFSTITAAVEEGRTGFSNIRKATLVVMANAFTELTLITSSLIFGTPFPITAVQILWVNLVTDSLPVLALAFEPSEKEVMRQKPTSPKEPILDKQGKYLIFGASLFSDLLLVAIFLNLLRFFHWELVKIQSLIFVATAIPTLLNVFAFKSLRLPLFRTNLANNPVVLAAAIFGFGLMAAAVYLPALNDFLKTTPLPLSALFVILGFAALKLTMIELVKFWYRVGKA